MSRTVSRELIAGAVHTHPWGQHSDTRKFEAFYLASSILASCGINVPSENVSRPILLLAGTSIPFSDQTEFVVELLNSEFEVASIANQIGGLFDAGLNPKKDRVDALRYYLEFLTKSAHVTCVDIIAQSYSAFEVTRLLLENPVKYRSIVNSVTFLNPPGFNENTGVIGHCSRFVWHHVLKGYSSATKMLISGRGEKEKDYAKREVRGISTWGYKSVKNPVRTMKEVLDIVSYKIKPHLASLQNDYRYDINIFLQSDDQILPVEITLRQIRGVVPDNCIKVVPGGHNDMFFQSWQRQELIDFIKGIRARANYAKREPEDQSGLGTASGQ